MVKLLFVSMDAGSFGHRGNNKMRHHYTEDPAQRAADIADHQAGPWYENFEEWIKVYRSALVELAGNFEPADQEEIMV